MLLDNNKKQYKQNTKNKHSLIIVLSSFSIFSCKNMIHDKMILFDVALLVQKNTTPVGYAERSIR